MNVQKVVAVIGAAVTSFLLVGAATIEVVFAATRADIGPGIIGVFAGVAAGLVAATLVAARWAAVRDSARSLLLGYGAFGLTVLFLAFLSYVNTPGVDEYLGLPVNLLIAAVVAVLVGLGRRGLRRSSGAL